jgi:hypothetical protein
VENLVFFRAYHVLSFVITGLVPAAYPTKNVDAQHTSRA